MLNNNAAVGDVVARICVATACRNDVGKPDPYGHHMQKEERNQEESPFPICKKRTDKAKIKAQPNHGDG